ncbi:Tuberous sclerosis 2-like protein [Malassezia brasiliensis]|uniref:Tuberous sclerosis 2-like protein n=1 Tax=Malassezia brasiliensis TaxID=1821822 RepID=A0AAF0DUY3_9BASI|nr:Tuberous sclerosis 2-like protein [Malassezia brasiliensis]
MDEPRAGGGKASLSVPFLRSFRTRSMGAVQGVSDAAKPVAEAGMYVTSSTEIHQAIDVLLQTKPGATTEPPVQLRTVVEALRHATEHGGALLDAATATPLVASLVVLCSRLMRPNYALDVRLGVCELLTATLRYAEESTARLDTSAHEARTLTGADTTLPSQVLSSLDRALLFQLVIALRDPNDWAPTQLVRDAEPALRTLECQIAALQALSRNGRDVLAFRSILVVLTEWTAPAWGCMLYERTRAESGKVPGASEHCAHALLALIASVIKFHASRIAAPQLTGALQCVADLVLRPVLLEARVPVATETPAAERSASGGSGDAAPAKKAEPLLYGYSHYGLEALSPYFSTPRPARSGASSSSSVHGASPGAERPAARDPSPASSARALELVPDAAVPALRDDDVRAVLKVLDAAVCFAFLPAPCIVPVVCALCRMPGLRVVQARDASALLDAMRLDAGDARGELGSALSNLLKSHCAYSVVRVLCVLLWPADYEAEAGGEAEALPHAPSVLVGALLFLHAALIWGAEDRPASGGARRGDESALALLTLPAIAGIVRGALEKDVPELDLATVLFLDDYLPERRVDVGVCVDAALERRVRQAPVPLCTVYRDGDVFADWELLHDLQLLAERHMAVWQAAQGAAPDAAPATLGVSRMVLHVLVELLSGVPQPPDEARRSASDDEGEASDDDEVRGRPGPPASAGALHWERPVVAMPHIAALFWPLAPLLPDHVLVDMVLQNRLNHAYVPSATRWIENTVQLVDTFFPATPRDATGLPAAPLASFEVVELISHMYDAVQDMPTFRNELIEHVVVPLVERALCAPQPNPELETMLRAMLRHAATVSALDASLAHGAPFYRLLRVLKHSIERAEGAEAHVERRQARAQHSRQRSLGPSNVSTLRESQAGIQRAIRSVRDMVQIFYQLAFAQPHAAVTLVHELSISPEQRKRAQTCSLAIFHGLLLFVQCNASFHLAGEASSGGASYTIHVPSEVRLVILQWLMRLRADRHHQIYFVHDLDASVEPLAQLVQRAEPEGAEEPRGREERAPGAGAEGGTPSSAGTSESRGRSRGRSRARDARSVERDPARGESRAPEPRVLWRVPERVAVDLPDEEWPSMLWRVYAHDHVGDEVPEAAPSADEALVLPTSEYLGVLIGLLQSEADWDVVSYIITHLPAQLMNKHCFCGPHAREQVAALSELLCTLLLQQRQFPNLLLPDDVKRTDMYAVLYATLTVLVSYRRCLTRAQHDALLEAFLAGLTKSQTTAQPCVRALVVACYELPKSFTRLVPTLLMKLSTIMSSMAASVHILELLVEISGLPGTYANFTEADYKRVFGIALQYIQYHHSSEASSREAMRSSPARFSLSQYVMMLAYSTIAQWFLTLRLGERPKYVPHITRGLMLANEGRDRLTDQTFVCLDFLARFTYSNAQSKPTRSLIRFLVTSAQPHEPRRPVPGHANESQTWLIGKGLVTLTSLKRNGWVEMLIRRPSGITSMVAKVENEPSNTLVDEERMAELLPLTLTRTRNASALAQPARLAPSPLTHPAFYKDRHSAERQAYAAALAAPPEAPEVSADAGDTTADAPAPAPTSPPEPSDAPAGGAASGGAPRRRDTDAIPTYLALQLSAYPDMLVDQAPLRLPSNAATDRLLRAIDLTPVYDFHKIGVVYVGFQQKTEREILSNTFGSSAYMKFLSRLGDLIPLRGQEDVYTGGLDRQQDEHGKYAYIWKDNIKQIVFHTATLMPNRPNDPTHAAKKALIGNDWVHIVFNESNQPYEFGTIASQFNFCNIVISPHSILRNGVEAYEVTDNMFFLVELQRRPGLPDFSAVGAGKLVSFDALPRFVCNLAMHCDLMSQIYLDTGESMVPYTSNWVTRLHHVERFRAQLEARNASDPEHASPNKDPIDQRDYTQLFD